jgi:hypothetical protein
MNDFVCPRCSGHLLVGGYIIFTVKTTKGKRGLILLSPDLGDYSRALNPGFNIEKGEGVEYLCPICHSNLAAYDIDKGLVRLIMIDDSKEKHEIFFSSIDGEFCTYKVSERKYEAYGSNSEKYDSYFRTRRV